MELKVLSEIKNRNWSVDYWNARIVRTNSEFLSVRNKIPQPSHNGIDEGLMVFVLHKGGIGYAASSDLSKEGIEKTFAKAKTWAENTAGKLAFSVEHFSRVNPVGAYKSPVVRDTNTVSFKEKLDLLRSASDVLSQDTRIVDSEASLSCTKSTSYFLSSTGADLIQEFTYIFPDLSAVAHENGRTQIRTLNGHAYARQGGFEIVEQLQIQKEAERISGEAIELLNAENCPSGTMDLILMPDQMMLQIHESIGHPIELDRILGDERNYAGTSFVTLDMFGSYQYGSPLLNVAFDPNLEGEFASYAFDDEGNLGRKEYLIQAGILKKPLGSLLSQGRANIGGVANGRASNWNRPPIDRMANLNIEPGNSTLAEMIQSTPKGVVMFSNSSWSIDDSRNKFQFGCEFGQLIENGKITKTVRSPNYRGISESFWRSLKMVGDHSTLGMYGTPYCGKGEPNQAIRVGHASPACLFSNVEIFGAES